MIVIKGRDTITILRRVYTGTVDERGNANPELVEIQVPGVIVAYGATADTITEISETINRAATLYFPKPTSLKKGDRFRLEDGSVWTLNGAVVTWTPPAGFRVKTRQVAEITRAEG